MFSIAVACFLSTQINDVEKGYYADGEDAYDMRKVTLAL